MLEIRTEHLFTIKINCDGPMHFTGALPQGSGRRVVTATSGTFEGAGLRGIVLPGGADYVIERPDGGLNLDVRLTLKTDQDEVIYLTYTGKRNGPPEVMEKLVRREIIPEGADYFRVAAFFETGSPRLRYLNDIIGIGAGTREANGPRYDMYRLL